MTSNFFPENIVVVTSDLYSISSNLAFANFAKLDSTSYLSQMRPISYEDRHQNQFNKQYEKQEKHFLKIENDWRHWAIVPAAYMLFK